MEILQHNFNSQTQQTTGFTFIMQANKPIAISNKSIRKANTPKTLSLHSHK